MFWSHQNEVQRSHYPVGQGGVVETGEARAAPNFQHFFGCQHEGRRADHSLELGVVRMIEQGNGAGPGVRPTTDEEGTPHGGREEGGVCP